MSNKIVTFFETVDGWLKTHFKQLPAQEVQVSSAVNYIVPFVEELDTLADPELAIIVNPILDRIKVGLAALATTIKASKTPTGSANVQSIVSSLAANATALETAFQVKDPASQQKVTSTLQLISGEIQAISAQFATPVKA